MKNLLLSSFLGLAALAACAAPSQAWTFGLIPDHCCPFGWGCGGCCGCNRYCSTITIKPYNAFTPCCCGNMCFDGRAPTLAPCCGLPCCGFPACGAQACGVPCCGPTTCCQAAPSCCAPAPCAPPVGGPVLDSTTPPPLAPPGPSAVAPPVGPVPLPTGPAPAALPPPGMGGRPMPQAASPVQTAVYQQVNPYAYAPANPYAYAPAYGYGYPAANPYAYAPMIPQMAIPTGSQPWYRGARRFRPLRTVG